LLDSSTKIVLNISTDHSSVTPLTLQLAKWRRQFSIETAKKQARLVNKQSLLCAVLCSGGCLDTLAAIRAGFKPIWSSEICKEQADMFENLTGGVCLGDTFGVKVKQAQFVQYIKSGQPCPNYSYSGDGTGQKGDTGWMFTKQVEVILHHLPWAFCLEISDNAPNINGGAEVSQVRKSLSAKYVVYGSVLKVWNYGDPSNRRRLFMVGLLADLGQTAHEFVWPTVSFDECGCIPVARCIAVPDSAVDASYWRDNHIKTDQLLKHSSSPHSLRGSRSYQDWHQAWGTQEILTRF
jgi:site-specific DNA-cytosine methylase